MADTNRPPGIKHTISTVYAGASVAVLPASLQATGARLFEASEQAALALAIGFGAVLAVSVNAWVLESRLATPGQQQIQLPRWTRWAGILSCILLTAGLVLGHWLIVTAIPIAMPALQLGRTEAVVAKRGTSETLAGTAMFLGCCGAIVLTALSPEASFVVLGLSIGIVCTARVTVANKDSVGMSPPIGTRLSVTFETLIVSCVPFIVNVVVLHTLGSQSAVGFRAVVTVMGILQPLLGVLRTRLLARHEPKLIATLGISSVAALLLVMLADLLGVFSLLFGSAWDSVSMSALAAASLWKLATIPGTVPFAALRRAGAATTTLVLRIATSTVSIALAIVAGHQYSTEAAVFGGLFVAEILTTIVLFAVYRRQVRKGRLTSEVDGVHGSRRAR